MLIINVLEKVKKRGLTNTRLYNEDWKATGVSDLSTSQKIHENFDLYCEICNAVGDGYLQGKKTTTENSTHYDELQLTKKGKEYLRLMTAPVNKLLKPSFAEVIAKSILGRLIAALLVPPVIFSFNFLFPELSEFMWRNLSAVLGHIKINLFGEA